MIRLYRLLIAGFLGVCGLLSAPVVSAQAWWYEIPVPHDSVFVAAKKGELFTQTYVIRSGQQPLYIQPDVSFSRVDVSVGGTTSYVYSGGFRSSGVLWTTPPATPGEYQVTAHVYYGGTFPYAYTFRLIVVPPAQRAFTDGQFLGARITYADTVRRANTMLLWQGGSGSMDKPFVVAEGIDASQSSGPAVYYAIGGALFQRGQAEGADVMILDFADGGRDMALNANVVIDALNMVRRLRTDQTRGIDLAGVSMGGVVVRYALAKMEGQQLPHDVARFVSMDGPQSGAVIDGELQLKIADYNQAYGAEIPLTFLRVAGAQLLRRNRFDFGYPTRHNAFYSELRALNGGTGYPRLTENVGVSFGADADENPNAGEEWLELRLPSFYPNDEFDVVGDIAVAGSFLPRDLTDIWGTVTRLRLTYQLERKTHPTFIPYESALDLTNGVSAFDLPLISASVPRFHNEVPPEVETPLLRRLGYEVPPPTQATINGPDYLQTGQTGYWSATVSPGPGYGYTHNWEYRIPCSDPGGGGGGAFAPDGDAKGEKPGDVTPNLVNCGQWYSGGVTAKFAHRSSSAVTLEIRVHVIDDGGSVTSPIKTVYISHDGGPELSRSSDGPQLDALTGAPFAFALEPSRPQPARSGAPVRLRFTLPEASDVRLVLYDLLGREVARLYDGAAAAGAHEVRADVPALPAGVYVYRLTAGSRSATRRLVVSD